MLFLLGTLKTTKRTQNLACLFTVCYFSMYICLNAQCCLVMLVTNDSLTYTHTPGMGIVKNTNFCGGETDFSCFFASLFVHVERNWWYQKREEEKWNTSFSFAPNTHEIYGARLLAAVACLDHVIVNTVTCYYSRRLAAGLNAVILTPFCATIRQRKSECYESFEGKSIPMPPQHAHTHTHSCDTVTGMNGWTGRKRCRGKKTAFDSIGPSLTGENMDEQLQLTFCKRVTSEVFNLKTSGMHVPQ